MSIYRAARLSMRAAAVAAAITPLALISGCSKHDPNAGMYSTAVIVVAVDSSVPGVAGRKWQTVELTSLERSASEAHYLFDLWAYSAAPSHLWGPTQLLDSDQANSASAAKLVPQLSLKRSSDRPGMLLAQLASERAVSSLPDGRVLILTDGYIAPRSGWAELSSSARLFVNKPGWRIEVLGIQPQYVGRWTKALAPSLAGRYQLVPEAVATSLLQENHDE